MSSILLLSKSISLYQRLDYHLDFSKIHCYIIGFHYTLVPHYFGKFGWYGKCRTEAFEHFVV